MLSRCYVLQLLNIFFYWDQNDLNESTDQFTNACCLLKTTVSDNVFNKGKHVWHRIKKNANSQHDKK